jgi:hypothetical protein
LEGRESVDAGMRHIEFLDLEIAAAEKLIAQQALSWPEIRRLMTVPGAVIRPTFYSSGGSGGSAPAAPVDSQMFVSGTRIGWH